MRGKLAKKIRKELAPTDKLALLRPEGPRVSRGEFFRVTTLYEIKTVPKSTLNPARQRKDIFTGERVNEEKVLVLGKCPRKAQQLVKAKLGDIRHGI